MIMKTSVFFRYQSLHDHGIPVAPNRARPTLLRAIAGQAARPGVTVRLGAMTGPTNNLDMASVRQLSQALEGYRGAILVASHDAPFLRSAGITRSPPGPGRLAEIDPL